MRTALLSLLATLLFALPASARQMTYGDAEVQTVVGANNALNQFFQLEIESMPPAMLQKAEGIAIFPNMIKGGFILGVNYGKGVLSVRNPDRTWSAPVLVTMGGGSVGFQAGVQAADIVLIFATPRSLQGLLNGQKVTLGADASIAVGPVGRQANAGTDAQLGAEIYSYARSRGLFLGVSLGGSDLSVDNNANSMLYGRFGVTPADVFQNRGIGMRPEVQQLVDSLNAKSRPMAPAAAVPVQPVQQAQPVQQVVGPPPFIQQSAPQPVQPAPAVTPQPQSPPLVPIK
jgi:lipid-binding SYLF domain-containing protein